MRQGSGSDRQLLPFSQLQTRCLFPYHASKFGHVTSIFAVLGTVDQKHYPLWGLNEEGRVLLSSGEARYKILITFIPVRGDDIQFFEESESTRVD